MILELNIKNIDKIISNYGNFAIKHNTILNNAMNKALGKATTISIRHAKKDWKGMKISTFKAHTIRWVSDIR